MTMRDSNPSQGFGNAQAALGDWDTDEAYWRTEWAGRPYAQADRDFGYYQPGYRYGHESATRYRGRSWEDVEPELRSGWGRYEHRGESTWDNVKHAARDAWDRVVHR